MERRLKWAQDEEEVGSNADCRVADLTRAKGGVLTFGAAMPAPLIDWMGEEPI